jgi:hypothetical protein
MNKRFSVFKLTDALSGISNEGIYTDDYSFDLSYPKLFNIKEDAEKYIKHTFIDYNERNIKNERFVILEVYFMDSDKIFEI